MNIVAHNLTALNSQRQFGINTNNKAKSTEKLSSGYRINRAADDAAGLAISEKMRRQIRGLARGVENTQDGVSLCQVADGALAEVNDMLHRMEELSVQSANGTNSDQDRQYIQAEVEQILQEIERISDSTTFNELKIFSPDDISLTVAPDPVSQIQSTFTILGTPTNLSAGTYTISADSSGIRIGQDSFTWDAFSLDANNLREGQYAFDYNGLNISFTVVPNATFDDVIQALDGATFDVNKQTSTSSVVTVTDCGVTAGTDTETFLSNKGTRYLYEGGYNVIADENGIYLEDYPGQIKTWDELGVDFSTSGEKTIQFSDSESGAYFTATIADGATKDDVIASINNTKFYWGYIDMSTRENARLGYSASSITANTIQDSTAPLRSVRLSAFGDIYDELYDDLGYTSKTDKLNDINLTVSISGSTKDDLKLTLTAENGNSTDLNFYSWDPPISAGYGYSTLVFGYNDGAQVRVRATYVDYDAPTNDEAYAYIGTLGELASNVSVQSPYYFKYKANKLVSETYSVDNVNTLDKINSFSSADSKQIWIQSGCEAYDGIRLNIDNMNTSILGIDDVDVSTVPGSNHAMSAVKGALQKVSANRSKIGAQQNRLEHTIANESNVVENTTAAESRIRDTDMAKEMVAYSNVNILEQAGFSMMAQANQSNQGILRLLQ